MMDERMDRTYSSGISVLCTSLASIKILLPRQMQAQPRCSRILVIQATSRIFGTLVRTVRPLCRRAAAIIGRTAFLEPCMDISPSKGKRPVTRIADKRPPPQISIRKYMPFCRLLCKKGGLFYQTTALIWLETLRTIPISTIRKSTEVPP